LSAVDLRANPKAVTSHSTPKVRRVKSLESLRIFGKSLILFWAPLEIRGKSLRNHRESLKNGRKSGETECGCTMLTRKGECFWTLVSREDRDSLRGPVRCEVRAPADWWSRR